MSRTDEDDNLKEITSLRLRLHHTLTQLERMKVMYEYISIEAKSFEAKWVIESDNNKELRDELQRTREDLDRVNQILSSIIKRSNPS